MWLSPAGEKQVVALGTEPPAVLRQQTGIPGQPVDAAADPGRIPEGEVRAARVPQLRRLPGGAAPAAVEVARHQHFEVVVLRQAVELLPVEAGAQRVPGAGEGRKSVVEAKSGYVRVGSGGPRSRKKNNERTKAE